MGVEVPGGIATEGLLFSQAQPTDQRTIAVDVLAV